ncbi:hypothetical protein [Acinetobacter sp. MB5]|nr:hypothetical protein [Acinetobacter sp. MB5]
MNHMLNLRHNKPHHHNTFHQLQWIVGCCILYAGLLILLNKVFLLMH